MKESIWVQRWVTAEGRPNGISAHPSREDVDRFIERVRTRTDPSDSRPEGAPACVLVESHGMERLRYLRSRGYPGLRLSHLGEL